MTVSPFGLPHYRLGRGQPEFRYQEQHAYNVPYLLLLIYQRSLFVLLSVLEWDKFTDRRHRVGYTVVDLIMGKWRPFRHISDQAHFNLLTR